MIPNILRSVSVPVTILSLCTLSIAERAYGLSLDPVQAGLIADLVVPDAEFLLLTEFVGFGAGELTGTSIITSGGFTGALSGTYLGQLVNITLSGNSSAFPGGPITYTTTGLYGSLPWSGSGTLLFTPTPTGFVMDYDSSLSIGSHSGLIDIQSIAADTGSNIVSAGTTGTVIADGQNISVELGYDCGKEPKVGTICEDIAFINNRRTVFSLAEIVAFTSDGRPVFESEYRSIPEPSTALMALGGALGLLGYAWRRRVNWLCCKNIFGAVSSTGVPSPRGSRSVHPEDLVNKQDLSNYVFPR